MKSIPPPKPPPGPIIIQIVYSLCYLLGAYILAPLIGIVVLLILISTCVNTKLPERPAPPAAHMGQEVRDGHFAFVVANVNVEQATISDHTGEYANVSMTVMNTSSTSGADFSASDQDMWDSAGNRYYAKWVEPVKNGVADLATESVWIEPTQQTDVILIYEISPGVQPTRVELHDSMFSNGATVSLITS